MAMAKQLARIEDAHRAFILRQRVFFTASAAAEGRVNVSPKGLDTLRALDANCVSYLDLTGSGNETSAHLAATGRLTLRAKSARARHSLSQTSSASWQWST
jgi:predicted pyridoxine 5'-phosphate oxidase superfamily flavin-nucleotide-binding protein